MERAIDFVTLLENVQQYISNRYSAALTNDQSQLKSYIEKYLRDNEYIVKGISSLKLVDMLYCEMAKYSILTHYLGRHNIEEININAWNCRFTIDVLQKNKKRSDEQRILCYS